MKLWGDFLRKYLVTLLPTNVIAYSSFLQFGFVLGKVCALGARSYVSTSFRVMLLHKFGLWQYVFLISTSFRDTFSHICILTKVRLYVVRSHIRTTLLSTFLHKYDILQHVLRKVRDRFCVSSTLCSTHVREDDTLVCVLTKVQK